MANKTTMNMGSPSPYADPFNTELRHIPTPTPYNPYNDPQNTELQHVPQPGTTWDTFNQNLQKMQAGIAGVDTTIGNIKGEYGGLLQKGATGAGGPGGDYPMWGQGGAPVDTGRRSALADFELMLNQWGLGGLSSWAEDLAKGVNAPTTANEFYLQLIQQPIYKERFGNTNQMRRDKGLPALSEAQIMNLESSYQNTMKAYGLPQSFYDNPKDYQQFIANDLSASELADRVQAAHSLASIQDPGLLNSLSQTYGIDKGAIAAYFLDPAKGQSVLTTLASNNTASIAAATAGMSADQANLALQMGAGNLSFQKQAEGFSQAQLTSQGLERLQGIQAQYGKTLGAKDALTDAFGGPGAAQTQFNIQQLGQKEINLFGGSSGIDKSSLQTRDIAGAL